MLLACALALLVLVLLALLAARPRNLLQQHNQTKVNFPYIPLIGHAYKFIGSNEDRMQMFGELARQAHANKHGAASFWLAHYLCVSISEPVAASVILRAFSDKWPVTLSMRHLLGNGSVFGEEEIWRLRRKILVPVFNSKYCDNFVKVFERNNRIMIEKVAAEAGRGDFSMWKYFSAYALDSAFDMAFGENVNVQNNPNHPFARAYQDYFKSIAARVCQPWLFSDALYELLPAGARQEHRRALMWDFVEQLIAKHKKAVPKERLENQLERDSQSKTGQFKSFLELLIEFSGEQGGYSDIELREETLVLLLAATDTTATASCLTAVLLANHPRVQRELCDEIQQVLGESGRSLDNLSNLKYLDAVVKETLRLYPPAPVTVRRCNRDIDLPSGLTLNEGCYFLVNFWGIHRNPHCWGPDADEFRPERFLSATPEQFAAFMPFGYGPRSCTGLNLALASVKLSIAELIRHYRLAPAASYQMSQQEPLRVTFDIMLKHVHNFEVRLEKRR